MGCKVSLRNGREWQTLTDMSAISGVLGVSSWMSTGSAFVISGFFEGDRRGIGKTWQKRGEMAVLLWGFVSWMGAGWDSIKVSC